MRDLDFTCKTWLAYYVTKKESAWVGSYSRVAVWSVAESCLGIVAACLPTVRPLFPKVLLQLANPRNGLNRSRNMNRAAGIEYAGTSVSIDKTYSDLQPLQDFHADLTMEPHITSDVRTEGITLRQRIGTPCNAIEVNTTTIWLGK